MPGATAQPLLYIDTSEIRDGALEEVKGAAHDLARFVEENVPRAVSYDVYFSPDGKQMAVTHLHPDSASLEQHMEVGAPAFRRFADLVSLSSIEVFGEPSARAVRQLEEKARALGGGRVAVYAPHAGFSRSAPAE